MKMRRKGGNEVYKYWKLLKFPIFYFHKINILNDNFIIIGKYYLRIIYIRI